MDAISQAKQYSMSENGELVITKILEMTILYQKIIIKE